MMKSISRLSLLPNERKLGLSLGGVGLKQLQAPCSVTGAEAASSRRLMHFSFYTADKAAFLDGDCLQLVDSVRVIVKFFQGTLIVIFVI
jgi:hypothetical protein